MRRLLAKSGERDSLGYFATRRDKEVTLAPSGRAAVTAPIGATLLARPAVPLIVRSFVDIKKYLGPRVEIDVNTPNGGRLPALAVVLRAAAEPADLSDGVTVCSYGGGAPPASLQLKRSGLFDGYLRLVALPEPGFVVEVHDPPLNRRHVELP